MRFAVGRRSAIKPPPTWHRAPDAAGGVVDCVTARTPRCYCPNSASDGAGPASPWSSRCGHVQVRRVPRDLRAHLSRGCPGQLLADERPELVAASAKSLARRRRELRSSTTSVRRPGSGAVSLTASAARSLTRRRNRICGGSPCRRTNLKPLDPPRKRPGSLTAHVRSTSAPRMPLSALYRQFYRLRSEQRLRCP